MLPVLKPLLLQAHLQPVLQSLRKLQYESKAIGCELEPGTAAASFMMASGPRMQQLQEKADALQQCIHAKLQQVVWPELPCQDLWQTLRRSSVCTVSWQTSWLKRETCHGAIYAFFPQQSTRCVA